MSISNTAYVSLNEPNDQIDLEAWLFGLTEAPIKKEQPDGGHR
jgi:hypothetical protein